MLEFKIYKSNPCNGFQGALTLASSGPASSPIDELIVRVSSVSVPCQFRVSSVSVPCQFRVSSMSVPCQFHVSSLSVPCPILIIREGGGGESVIDKGVQHVRGAGWAGVNKSCSKLKQW